MKPISPDDLPSKSVVIPDEVIDVINHSIRKKWDGVKSVLTGNDLARDISFVAGSYPDIVAKKYFPVIEGVYTKAGWRVEYTEGQSFNEATFTFYKEP